MKNFLYFFVAATLILFIIVGYFVRQAPFHNEEIKVLLLYSPSLMKKYGGVLEAYKSVLEEEGIPYAIVETSFLLNSDINNIVKYSPAIILPDGVSQILPKDITNWLENYLQRGGSLVVVFDTGTKNWDGTFLDECLFNKLTGVNYCRYNDLKENAYTTATVQFKNAKSIDFFQIPPGKIDGTLFLSGYGYGRLKYPVARVTTEENLNEKDIYAYAITAEKDRYPLLVRRSYQTGNLLYVNLPLGYLKMHSDDLPLRTIMRAFLFTVVKIPHLMNTPFGKGGLVINWHIDDKKDWEYIPRMIYDRLLRRTMEYSLHITAGDFVNEPGDVKGFDACGKGRRYAEMLIGYGTIGSHGGWAHNFFAEKVAKGIYKKGEITKYIEKNRECLQRIAGYKVVEYSAPVGVHPQPLMTQVLEKLGFIVYYSAGDSGSAPNRTFYNDTMISHKVIAFPVMPFEGTASLAEMCKKKKSVKEVTVFLIDTLHYVANKRTARLIYSHMYDLYYNPECHNYQYAFKAFLDCAENMQRRGKLHIKSMNYFAQFLLRLLETKYAFTLKQNGLEVTLYNPEGLEGITIAIPKNYYKKPLGGPAEVEEDTDYYYVSIKERVHESRFNINTL
jgi:hypothetical protein